MGEDSLKITYETLFELARREKQRGELQKLDESFIDDVKGYVADKKALVQAQSHKHDLETSTKKSRLLTQLDNIKNLLRDLYERRERKIVNMAINRVKVNSKIAGEQSLLIAEQDYYNALIASFREFRQKIYLDLINASHSSVSASAPLAQSPEIKSETEAKPDIEEKAKEAKFSDASTLPKTDKNGVPLKFLVDVGKFYDEDLSVYGPYKANDEARLPGKLADVLIKKGAAEEF